MSNTATTLDPTKKKEKKVKQKVDWKLVRSLMKGRWWLFLAAFAFMVVSALASYASPLVIRMTIDSIIGNEPMQAPGWLLGIIENLGGREMLGRNLWICSLIIILLASINSLFAFLRGRVTAIASESVAQDLRNRMYAHLQHLSYEYHVTAETGDLLQRCSSDVETLRRFLSMQLVEIGRTLVSTVLGISVMVSLNASLTLISLVMLPILFVVSMYYYKRMQSTFLKTDEAEGALSNMVQESLTGIRVVRAFGQQRQEMDKFDKRNLAFREAIIRVNLLMGIYWGMTDVLTYIQQAVVLIVGTSYVIHGQLSVGTLIAFTTYIGMLLWPARQLGRILADAGKSTVALGRIKEVLDQPEEPRDGLVGDAPLSGDIVFDHVSFSYNDEKKVLDDISFTVKQGQTVAILGATGSGKSTLMHLLQRLYDYDKGSITIGGTEIRDFNRKWLRKNVGIVLQEPFLFSRSIRDNIAITRPSASEEEVMEAARIAALSGVIAEFDKGYETEVGERGVTLSGGQKQRVAIARMLMQNTPILIFDDSLSALDTETDQMIREQLKQRRTSATTFIISHRITTLAEADFIIVMEDGRISEIGTHAELIQVPGLYQRVWSIQSALEDELRDETNGNGQDAGASEATQNTETKGVTPHVSL